MTPGKPSPADVLPLQSLLTIEQVATVLHVSERTVHRMIKGGELRVVRIRGTVRINPTVLEALIKESDRI